MLSILGMCTAGGEVMRTETPSDQNQRLQSFWRNLPIQFSPLRFQKHLNCEQQLHYLFSDQRQRQLRKKSSFSLLNKRCFTTCVFKKANSFVATSISSTCSWTEHCVRCDDTRTSPPAAIWEGGAGFASGRTGGSGTPRSSADRNQRCSGGLMNREWCGCLLLTSPSTPGLPASMHLPRGFLGFGVV